MTRRREFPQRIKVAAFKRCDGFCEDCDAKLWPGKYQFDHDLPDGLGGEPTLENCKVRCSGPGSCHEAKTGKRDVPMIAKSKRQRAGDIGAKTRRGPPMPGSKASGIRKRMDGTVERRELS